MTHLLEIPLKRVPGAFARFSSSLVNLVVPGKENISPELVTRSIACQCGNRFLYLMTAQTKELRGVCIKSTFTRIAPPIYAVCPDCQKKALLFDPILHGWSGELELVPDKDSPLSLIKYRQSPGNIYVQCTYRNIDKYATLIEKGIEDLENYFDSFSLLYTDSQGEKITELMTQECI